MGVVLTTVEVSRRLAVSPSTVRNWADAGLLRSYKLPYGHRRFDSVVVERFLSDMHPAGAE